jgi:hypothetical protein
VEWVREFHIKSLPQPAWDGAGPAGAVSATDRYSRRCTVLIGQPRSHDDPPHTRTIDRPRVVCRRRLADGARRNGKKAAGVPSTAPLRFVRAAPDTGNLSLRCAIRVAGRAFRRCRSHSGSRSSVGNRRKGHRHAAQVTADGIPDARADLGGAARRLPPRPPAAHPRRGRLRRRAAAGPPSLSVNWCLTPSRCQTPHLGGGQVLLDLLGGVQEPRLVDQRG